MKISVFILFPLLVLGLSACAESSAPEVTASTVSVDAQERLFVSDLIDDVAYWGTIFDEAPNDLITSQRRYSQISDLSSDWALRQAPSERSERVLTEWRAMLRVFEQGYEALAEGRELEAMAIFEDMDADEHGARLGEMVRELGDELGMDVPAMIDEAEAEANR